jgi:hypothetical protein
MKLLEQKISHAGLQCGYFNTFSETLAFVLIQKLAVILGMTAPREWTIKNISARLEEKIDRLGIEE